MAASYMTNQQPHSVDPRSQGMLPTDHHHQGFQSNQNYVNPQAFKHPSNVSGPSASGGQSSSKGVQPRRQTANGPSSMGHHSSHLSGMAM